MSRLADKRFTAYLSELGWKEDPTDPSHVMLLELCTAVEEARSMIRNSVKSLRSDLDHLEAQVSAHSPLLNTLGELQQRPAAVEAAVGAFAVADRLLRVFMKAHKNAIRMCVMCGQPRSKHVRGFKAEHIAVHNFQDPEEGCAVCGEPRDGERHRDDVMKVTGTDHKFRRP
jgi:ribosomal protein L37E